MRVAFDNRLCSVSGSILSRPSPKRHANCKVADEDRDRLLENSLGLADHSKFLAQQRNDGAKPHLDDGRRSAQEPRSEYAARPEPEAPSGMRRLQLIHDRVDLTSE